MYLVKTYMGSVQEEFDTLAEAIRFANRYSKENDYDIDCIEIYRFNVDKDYKTRQIYGWR